MDIDDAEEGQSFHPFFQSRRGNCGPLREIVLDTVLLSRKKDITNRKVLRIVNPDAPWKDGTKRGPVVYIPHEIEEKVGCLILHSLLEDGNEIPRVRSLTGPEAHMIRAIVWRQNQEYIAEKLDISKRSIITYEQAEHVPKLYAYFLTTVARKAITGKYGNRSYLENDTGFTVSRAN